jgi:hypothetical protein
MITTIDNNLRVFQVIDSLGRSTFCNLHDLNEVCKDMLPGYYTIKHFWNAKPKRVSKKYLAELMQANNIVQTFKY